MSSCRLRAVSKQKESVAYVAILLINYIAITIYSFLTPPVSDDLYWHPGTKVPMSEILRDTLAYYINWLGRVESYFYTRVMDALPKYVYNLVNGFFFVGLILSIYLIARKKEKNWYILALISLYIWIWGIDFAQTMLWVCGSCNYLWCVAIEFGLLAFFKCNTDNPDKWCSQEKWKVIAIDIGLFLWGVLAGNGNENVSGGVLLLVVFYTVKYCIEDRKPEERIAELIRSRIRSWQISGIAGLIVGLAVLVLSPGNTVRGMERLMDEENTGFLLYLGRFLKINDIIYDYMRVLIIVTIILFVYVHIYVKPKIKDLIEIYALIIASIITTYILLITTIPMPRAFLGGSLMLLVACARMIDIYDDSNNLLRWLHRSAVYIMAVYMLYTYFDCAADLLRIDRELKARQEYVEEQKAMGNYSLELPMVRKEWDNKYTFLYQDNDISEDPDAFGNSIYRVYYGLEEVIGVPYDEWEKKRDK